MRTADWYARAEVIVAQVAELSEFVNDDYYCAFCSLSYPEADEGKTHGADCALMEARALMLEPVT